MNKKRILSIALLAGMLLTFVSLAAACSNKDETLTVQVKIVGLDDDLICDKEVTVTGTDLTIKNALEQACLDVGQTLRYSADGTKPIQIGSYIDLEDAGASDAYAEEIVEADDEANAEEAEEVDAVDETESIDSEAALYYWDYTLNGAEAAGGSSVQKISEGDVIVWTWTKLELTEE